MIFTLGRKFARCRDQRGISGLDLVGLLAHGHGGAGGDGGHGMVGGQQGGGGQGRVGLADLARGLAQAGVVKVALGEVGAQVAVALAGGVHHAGQAIVGLEVGALDLAADAQGQGQAVALLDAQLAADLGGVHLAVVAVLVVGVAVGPGGVGQVRGQADVGLEVGAQAMAGVVHLADDVAPAAAGGFHAHDAGLAQAVQAAAVLVVHALFGRESAGLQAGHGAGGAGGMGHEAFHSETSLRFAPILGARLGRQLFPQNRNGTGPWRARSYDLARQARNSGISQLGRHLLSA